MPNEPKKNRQKELDASLASAMMNSPIMTPADIYAAVGAVKDGTYVAVRASIEKGGKPSIITVVEPKSKASAKDIAKKIADEAGGKLIDYVSCPVTKSTNEFLGRANVKIGALEEEAGKNREKGMPTMKRS